MTDRQIRDELMTAVFGAYKGIPWALVWMWYRLSLHPAIRRRVQDELRRVVGGRAPMLDDLPRLDYSRTVLDEVLRLHPPLWIMSRPPVEADQVAGYNIPAGMFVLVIPYITHRHSAHWDSPEAFDPTRFSRATSRSDGRHRFAYIPFAAGPRMCAGEELARSMMLLILAAVGQRYRLDLVPGHLVSIRQEFLLRPQEGLPMMVEPAASAPLAGQAS